MITVRGHQIEPDITAEVGQFDIWQRAKWTGTRLIACSPFRYESTPSFAVNLENGTWIDSGGEGVWRKGSLVQLLAFLRNETYVETEDYLISMYSPLTGDIENLELTFNFQNKESEKKYFTIEDLQRFAYRHPYLGRRGITDQIQRAFKIGYDKKGEAIVIPWFDRQGRIVNMKFRSVKDKRFWYTSEGQKIGNHIYGIHLIQRKYYDRVAIVESETDCMYLWKFGIAAIALGGSNVSKAQRKLLLQSATETYIIATDNDKMGEKAKRILTEVLSGIKNVEYVTFPHDKKDVNELTPLEVEHMFNNTTTQRICF